MTIDLPTGRRGQIIAVTILLMLIAVAWIGIIEPLTDLYAQRFDMLRERLLLADKMDSIAKALPTLRRTAHAQSASASTDQSGLKGATDAIAGANLSILVEHLSADAGLRVSSVEEAPAEKSGNTRRIGITVHGSGDYKAVVQLLDMMSRASPKLFIDGLALHKAGEGDQRHGMEAVLTVYATRDV